MMANKKLKINEIIVENIDNEYELRRDSMSDRFCDDLLEVILNYLSIEEKIRFECISKQWKKLIFNKQKSLEIFGFRNGAKDKLIKLLNIPEIKQKYGFPAYIYNIQIKTLENVLKKFMFLNHLCFGNINLKNKSEVLNAVTDNCDYLKTIEFDFRDICGKHTQKCQTLNKFCLKFGQQLKEIHFLFNNYSLFNVKSIIKMFPNLSVIKNVRINDLIEDKEVLVKSITKLMSCAINVTINENELFDFKLFAENNCNSIESLDIFVVFNNDIERTDFLKHISVMKKLKVLKIESIDCDHYSKSFRDDMKSIADNCKQLKELSFNIINKKSFDIKHAFESFANFKNLTKLCFCLTSSQTSDEEYRIDCLKNCKLLTHLTLNTSQINDNFIVGIDSIVSQLKQLYIKSNAEISDKALDSISKLKHLEVLEFDQIWPSIEFKTITDLGLISLIKNCQNLKSIIFTKRPNITHKTIDALKEKALKNPRIYFRHYFSLINDKSDDFTAIDSKSYSSLPFNLKIYPISSQTQ